MDGRAVGRIQAAGEGIRMHTAGLVHERRLQEIAENALTAPEWRLGAELLEYELLDWVVENSISHADARFSRSAGQLGQPSIMRTRAPVKAKPPRKRFVVAPGHPIGHPLFTRKHYAQP